MTPLLVMIGGFLGAGKTTLIAAIARRLTAQGRRVAVLTNDQAPDLVDSALVRRQGIPVAEVAGACFCCAFPSFLEHAERLLAEHAPEVLLAEPVGSCVDLAATVLRPLAERRQGLGIAPFSVGVDPAAWAALGHGALPPATAYIVRQQVREADVLLVTKADTVDPAQRALISEQLSALRPGAPVLAVSALTGEGLDAWLALLSGGPAGGQQHIAIDYDLYAEGEAQLGWLNATVHLLGSEAWLPVVATLQRALWEACAAAGAPPVRIKLLLESGACCIVADAVTGRAPELRRLADGPADREARLIINARVPMPPERMREIVSQAVLSLPAIESRVRALRAFAPPRPVPVQRIA
ncbi:MAG: CobW-like GTP-binding protein [Planctomycetes bacterium]|nr:CobW-like GTP-binding protein [Planctomycetota bacterium]